METINLKKTFIIPIAMAYLLIIAGVVNRPIMYFAFAYVAIMVVICNERFSTAILFAIFPFATIFKTGVSSSSFFTYIEIIYVFKALVRNHVIRRSFVIPYIAYLIMVILGMGSSYSEAIKQLLIPVIIYILINNTEKRDFPLFAETFSFGVLAASVLGYFKEFIPNLSVFIIFKDQRMETGNYISRFSGTWGDPNYYATNVLLAMTLIFFLHNKKLISGKFAWCMYVLFAFFGALTGSKSFILILLCAVVVAWLYLLKSKHIKAFFFFTFVFIMASYLVLTGRIQVFSVILERMQESNLTSNRFDIWGKYILAINDKLPKLLFGNGVGKFFTYGAPHNTLLDYLDIYGVVGTTISFLTIYEAGKSEHTKPELLNLIPWIVIIVSYSLLSMIFYLDLVFHITLAIMALSFSSRDYMELEGISYDCN